jgi:biopolymer transport protein TolQ
MNSDMSILSLVQQASALVQFVMALLLAISVASWLYQQVQDKSRDHGSLARIFEAGMSEFLKVRQQKPGDPMAMLDGARRAMRASYQREVDMLESSVPFLASAGSVSPYIGLFGTVWGIMNSFRGLVNVQQATLASVAPGIAEALVATAIGLFAAIPAFVAYNRFSHDLDRLASRFETFIEEFSNILQRRAR